MTFKLKKYIPLFFFVTILSLFFASKAYAQVLDKRGRLGIGTSNQFVVGIPAISFKLQKSRSFAYGVVLAAELDDRDGGHGAGVKLYKNFFEEPQLQFYGSVLIAMVNNKTGGTEEDGFQIDLTLGPEFHWPGLESLGFSFEFGLSINSLGNDTVVSTAGYHFVTAGIHFYL